MPILFVFGNSIVQIIMFGHVCDHRCLVYSPAYYMHSMQWPLRVNTTYRVYGHCYIICLVDFWRHFFSFKALVFDVCVRLWVRFG